MKLTKNERSYKIVMDYWLKEKEQLIRSCEDQARSLKVQRDCVNKIISANAVQLREYKHIFAQGQKTFEAWKRGLQKSCKTQSKTR